jgi:hypothetical protein
MVSFFKAIFKDEHPGRTRCLCAMAVSPKAGEIGCSFPEIA